MKIPIYSNSCNTGAPKKGPLIYETVSRLLIPEDGLSPCLSRRSQMPPCSMLAALPAQSRAGVIGWIMLTASSTIAFFFKFVCLLCHCKSLTSGVRCRREAFSQARHAGDFHVGACLLRVISCRATCFFRASTLNLLDFSIFQAYHGKSFNYVLNIRTVFLPCFLGSLVLLCLVKSWPCEDAGSARKLPQVCQPLWNYKEETELEHQQQAE